jgi:hypothetical protein
MLSLWKPDYVPRLTGRPTLTPGTFTGLIINVLLIRYPPMLCRIRGVFEPETHFWSE